MNLPYSSDLTNPLSTYHWALKTSTTLARPVSTVWPLFKDFYRWYTEYTCETVAGPPYRPGSGLLEGQVLKLTSSVDLPRAGAQEFLGPKHYVQKTLKVLNEEEIVVVLSGSAYDFERYAAFYIWRMRPHQDHTEVLIDTYGEGVFFRPLREDHRAQYHEEFIRNWHRSWSLALENLRSMLA
jgi:hypothetical protein